MRWAASSSPQLPRTGQDSRRIRARPGRRRPRATRTKACSPDPKLIQMIVEQVFGQRATPGEMTDLHLTTPIIEIADDLETARAVFWCPGAGAMVPTTRRTRGHLDLGHDRRRPRAQRRYVGDLAPPLLPLHQMRHTTGLGAGHEHDQPAQHAAASALIPDDLPQPLLPRCPSVTGFPPLPRPYATYDGSDWMLDRDKIEMITFDPDLPSRTS